MKTRNNARSLNEIGAHIRQGDVMLRRISKIPRNLQKTEKVTLALGEKTFHHHTINSGAIGYAEKPDQLADYVKVKSSAVELEHQEHSIVQLPPGDYEKLVQVEDTFVPVKKENITERIRQIRQVED